MTAFPYPSFSNHYLEYILSPPVLLTLWIICIPLILERYKDKILPPSRPPLRAPGCFRLGLKNRSNLPDEHQKAQVHQRQTSIGGDALTGTPKVKALFTYPLKSCAGVELTASEIGATGLKYDRLFTFATSAEANEASSDEKSDQPGWKFITQRAFPKLALLKTELWAPDPRASRKAASANGKSKSGQGKRGRTESKDESAPEKTGSGDSKTDLAIDWASNGGCLVVQFPHKPSFNPFGLRTENVELRIPLTPSSRRAHTKQYPVESLTIWKDSPNAINMTNEIDPSDLTKLKSFLGIVHPLALFRTNPQDQRLATRCLPSDRDPETNYPVSFADAFPINILNLASVRSLEASLPSKATMKNNLDPRRFRANIYITGPGAYAEDSWKRLTVGRCIAPRAEGQRDRSPARDPAAKLVETDGMYHVACRTARCTLPNVDQNTGVRDRNEPYTTLRKERVVDEGAKPHAVLGLHMIPLFAQGIVRVGDEIEVLERGEHVYEKMFKG